MPLFGLENQKNKKPVEYKTKCPKHSWRNMVCCDEKTNMPIKEKFIKRVEVVRKKIKM